MDIDASECTLHNPQLSEATNRMNDMCRVQMTTAEKSTRFTNALKRFIEVVRGSRITPLKMHL